MAVSGVGIQSVAQFIPRSSGELREQQLKSEQRNSHSNSGVINSNAATETNISVINSTTANDANKSELITTVPAPLNTNQATPSRRDLADAQSSRTQFQLQKESRVSSGESGRALQSFIDVADFERKDELTNLVGIDIFI